MNDQHPSETPVAPSESVYPAPQPTYTPTHAAVPVVPEPAPVAFPQPGAHARPMVAPKNPAIALFASFFFPGLGTLMNGQAGKGIAIFVGYFFAVLLSIILIGIPFAIGLWIWGMVDAYTGAKSWNARHGIIS